VRSLAGKGYNSSIEKLGNFLGALAGRRIERGRLYFPFFSQLLSQVPFAFGLKLRRSVYAKVLAGMGNMVEIHHGVTFEDPRTIFGSNIWISVGTYIDYAIIEDQVLIGQNTVILAGKSQHNFDRTDIPVKLQGNPPKEPITIGHGAWIGANATVMANIGNDSIVGAGSVVTKPVPPFAIVAGNPARVLRMRK
jgi:virginiamycin A acetyltransferase